MNEFDVIAHFFARDARSPSVRLGVGDDAALLRPTVGCELVASVDMLVAGRHFFADAEPEALGHKALAVNLSDMAAMGATPRWALLALALPNVDEKWLTAFSGGFHALARAHEVDLVGGDTTRGPLNICVTIHGEVPCGQAITRGGAKPGDTIYVSGVLGDAALAVAASKRKTTLQRDALAQCRSRLDKPSARVALGQCLRGVATAMIDVSDGLIGDIGHIIERSNVGAAIDLAALPHSSIVAGMLSGPERTLALQCLLAGGDDYELCFTAPANAEPRLVDIARELDLPLTRIGVVTSEIALVVRDEHGAPLADLPCAYDHFAAIGA